MVLIIVSNVGRMLFRFVNVTLNCFRALLHSGCCCNPEEAGFPGRWRMLVMLRARASDSVNCSTDELEREYLTE
jgi:hypothetical protein